MSAASTEQGSAKPPAVADVYQAWVQAKSTSVFIHVVIIPHGRRTCDVGSLVPDTVNVTVTVYLFMY